MPRPILYARQEEWIEGKLEEKCQRLMDEGLDEDEVTQAQPGSMFCVFSFCLPYKWYTSLKKTRQKETISSRTQTKGKE